MKVKSNLWLHHDPGNQKSGATDVAIIEVNVTEPKSPRKSFHYPRDSKTNEFLDKMRKERPGVPLWMFFDEMISRQPQSKEEWLIALYDEFIRNACELYSAGNDEKDKLQMLKKIIFRKIFKFKSEWLSDPDDSYYENLKKF